VRKEVRRLQNQPDYCPKNSDELHKLQASLLVKWLHRFYIPHKEEQSHDIAKMLHMVDRIFILISLRALSLFNHIQASIRRLLWCKV